MSNESRLGLLGHRAGSGREVWLLRVGSLQPENVRKTYRSRLKESDPESHLLTDGIYVVFEHNDTVASRVSDWDAGDLFSPETVGLAEADNLLDDEEDVVTWLARKSAKWYSENVLKGDERAIRHEVEWFLDNQPGVSDPSDRTERYEQEEPPGSPEALLAEREAFIADSPNPEKMRWFSGLASEEQDSVLRQFEEQWEENFSPPSQEEQEELQRQQDELEAQLSEKAQDLGRAQDHLRRSRERQAELSGRVEDAHMSLEAARADLDHTISKIGGYEIAAALEILQSAGNVEEKTRLADAARAAYPSGFLGVGLEDLYLMREGTFLRSLRRGQKELHRAVRKLCDQRRRERGSRWRLGSLQPSDELELTGIMNQANALRFTVLICRHPYLERTSQLFDRYRAKDLHFMGKLGLVPFNETRSRPGGEPQQSSW